MTYIKLGDGRYCVSAGHANGGVPGLQVRRLPRKTPVGTLLAAGRPRSIHDYDLVIEVATPEAAGVLLAVAQAIAFEHGLVARHRCAPRTPRVG